MAKQTEGTRLKGETVTPHETMRLVKQVGVSQASRLLGVSTTQLHKARRGNVVSRVTEVAAKGVLSDLAAEGGNPKAAAKRVAAPAAQAAISAGPAMMLLEDVPSGKRAILERFLTNLGVKYTAA